MKENYKSSAGSRSVHKRLWSFISQMKERVFEFLFRNSQTKIRSAVEKGNVELLVEYHSKLKYNFAFVGKNKESLLHVAVKYGQKEVVNSIV
jgi:hypothetical protein